MQDDQSLTQRPVQIVKTFEVLWCCEIVAEKLNCVDPSFFNLTFFFVAPLIKLNSLPRKLNCYQTKTHYSDDFHRNFDPFLSSFFGHKDVADHLKCLLSSFSLHLFF